MTSHHAARASSSSRIPWLAASVAVVFVLMLAACSAVFAYPFWFRSQVYPGVSVAGIHLGDLSRGEAALTIQQAVDAWARVGIRVEGFGKSVVVSPMITALEDPDFSYELVQYDVEAMTEEAWRIGRGASGSTVGAWAVNALTAAGLRVSPVDLPARYRIDGERVRAFVESEFGRYETPAQDARLTVSPSGHTEVRAEREGERIDMTQAGAAFAAALEHFSSSPIQLTLIKDMPRVRAEQVHELLPRVSTVLEKAPYRVLVPPETYEQVTKELGFGAATRLPRYLEIPRESLVRWLTAVPGAQGNAALALDRNSIVQFLAPIAALANRPAVDAKFTIHDGKVTEFQGSHDGRELDTEISRERIEDAFLVRGEVQAYLVMRELKATIQTEAVNGLGVTELLGTGRSNFSGSPKNRRHNIGVGVAAVNGVLIPPGEEFSLLKTLGEVDAAAGYLPELVIKGNRTIPEYGGGLCQIGTTAFRAALASGMPITERRNHSYRVRYYEPAGTDATIYSPSPDFRFLNDTGAHLLFQAHVEGDDAIFELWGTSDGRIATSTSPVVYNIVPPAPTQLVETTDLKPGEKRCTESAHSGADARFTYTVAYPDGRVAEEQFVSHYRPWQAVCLVGVEKLSEEAGGENGSEGSASSTATGAEGAQGR